MRKINIRNFLENKLHSHPDYITDDCDRLVWLSDVIDAVDEMLDDSEVIK